MRCPRCLLADIPDGMGLCLRCGYALPAALAARGGGAARAASSPEPASAPEARRLEWLGTPRRSGPAQPVVIMDDGDEDEEDEDRDPAPRPARHIGRGIAGAVGLAIALGSGAVWLGSWPPPAPPAPAPQTTPGGVDPAAATLSAPTPAAPDSAAPSAAPPAPVVAAPRPRSDPPPVARPITPRRGAFRAEPALLSINSIPWGSVSIDGRAVGNTPQLNLRIAPGSHRLRVKRDGFQPYERVIAVAPGQRLRITDIALVARE